MLVYFPESERFNFTSYAAGEKVKTINDIIIHSRNDKGEKLSWGVAKHMLPPYFVLVNVKTGKWTTSERNPLAQSAPLDELRNKIGAFYGDEMSVYGGDFQS